VKENGEITFIMFEAMIHEVTIARQQQASFPLELVLLSGFVGTKVRHLE